MLPMGPATSAKNAVPTVTMANGGDVGASPKIRYKCPFCPFSSDSQAPVHSHLKAKKYRCSGCGFLTCSKEAITQHQMDKHGKTHIQLEQQERLDRQEQQQQQQAKRPGPTAVASMSDGGPAAKKRNTGRSPSAAPAPPPIGPPPAILASPPPPLPSGGIKLGSPGMPMIQLPTTPVPPPQLMDANIKLETTPTGDLPGLAGIKLPQHPAPPTPPTSAPLPPPLPSNPLPRMMYTCAICRSFNATTEAAVEDHARLAHNVQQQRLGNPGSEGPKQYLCQFCDFVSTTSKEETVNHILSAHPQGSAGPPTTYACPQCTYKSTVASEIERHLRESHTLNPAPPVAPPPVPPVPPIPPELETTRYACAYCNFVSDSVPAVQAHSLEVHNVALAGADEATEMLQTTQPPPPPLPHIPLDPAAAASAPPAPLPMICPHCGAGFDESSLFKAHLDSHGNSALASSGATPPTTPAKAAKSTPARKGPKPSLRKNFCETCSLQLPDRNSYIAHNRANHPQRNKCLYCDYTSPRPYNVKAHTEQVHFHRKPHACDACDFKASRRSALEQHVQNKHPGHPPPPVGWKRPGEAEEDEIPLLPIKVPGKVEHDPHGGGEHESPNRVLVQPANGSSNLNSLQFMLDDGPGTPVAAAVAAGRGDEGQAGTIVVGKMEGGSGGNDSGISSSNHSGSVIVDNLTYPSAQLGVMSDMNDVLNGYHAAVHDDINMVSAEETVVSSNNNEHGGQQFILSDVALEGQAGSVAGATGPNGEQILATVDISSAEGQQALLDYSAAEASFNGGGQQVLASLDVEGMPPVLGSGGVKPKKQFHRNQPTETELTCDLCGYLANSRYAKKRHIKLVHDKRKDYTCTLCNQMFGQHGDAKRHAASKHKIPDGSTVKRLCFD